MVGGTILDLPAAPPRIATPLLLSSSSFGREIKTRRNYPIGLNLQLIYNSYSSLHLNRPPRGICVVACLPPRTPKAASISSIKLFVSGLSFRTTKEKLTNAFQIFGELVEVNLVMDRIANRSRGFAFLRYSTDEESKKAIDGMHGKFLDGRVIFVEVAKLKAELRQDLEENPQIQY